MKKSRKNSGTTVIEADDVSSPFVIRKTVVVVDSLETGRALRTLREQHKISARRVATMLGISPMSASLYERGRRSISPTMARHFVEAIYAECEGKIPKLFQLSPGDEE